MFLSQINVFSVSVSLSLPLAVTKKKKKKSIKTYPQVRFFFLKSVFLPYFEVLWLENKHDTKFFKQDE